MVQAHGECTSRQGSRSLGFEDGNMMYASAQNARYCASEGRNMCRQKSSKSGKRKGKGKSRKSTWAKKRAVRYTATWANERAGRISRPRTTQGLTLIEWRQRLIGGSVEMIMRKLRNCAYLVSRVTQAVSYCNGATELNDGARLRRDEALCALIDSDSNKDSQNAQRCAVT
ncbi:hypothetical protein J3458_002894 [Metarhizium acridum]|uniref:uncharacterized protein n=1 Tax=Metarhizium acridum TaxID=92637 RepID=UPI001C6CB3F5|nr:hypothetical protein J3458_002894 [Metarhizium acridum]